MPSKQATGTPDLAGDAVSNTSEESSAPVKRGLEGSADTVTNSGMQGHVAESATSSNARQQSTASVASTRPASASKPTSTIGACTCALHGTLSLCIKSSIFATAFMPLSVGLLGTMTACFDAEAEWHLLPAWRLAKKISTYFLWPSTFDLVCLGSSQFLSQPRTSASLFHAWTPF